MGQQEPILLLTRPEPDSRSFLAQVEHRLGHGVPSVISPLLKIVAADDLSDLDLNAYRTLIITSRNAVNVLQNALAGRNVVTVGERTAERATSLGARATCLGANVDEFLQRLDVENGPMVHLRGVHTRGDLVPRARDAGADIGEKVVYDQLELGLDDEAQEILKSGRAVVPLFSPRTAALLSKYPCHIDTKIVAMSPAVAEAWTGPPDVDIAARPDSATMCDLVAVAF